MPNFMGTEYDASEARQRAKSVEQAKRAGEKPTENTQKQKMTCHYDGPDAFYVCYVCQSTVHLDLSVVAVEGSG